MLFEYGNDYFKKKSTDYTKTPKQHIYDDRIDIPHLVKKFVVYHDESNRPDNPVDMINDLFFSMVILSYHGVIIVEDVVAIVDGWSIQITYDKHCIHPFLERMMHDFSHKHEYWYHRINHELGTPVFLKGNNGTIELRKEIHLSFNNDNHDEFIKFMHQHVDFTHDKKLNIPYKDLAIYYQSYLNTKAFFDEHTC